MHSNLEYLERKETWGSYRKPDSYSTRSVCQSQGGYGAEEHTFLAFPLNVNQLLVCLPSKPACNSQSSRWTFTRSCFLFEKLEQKPFGISGGVLNWWHFLYNFSCHHLLNIVSWSPFFQLFWQLTNHHLYIYAPMKWNKERFEEEISLCF
jgi:hypothetical protein